jgi:simple sugar transport system ATP-binding protein
MGVFLETRNLTKRFGSLEAVAGASIAFEPGLIHAVLGENGAGKTTLLKMLFGLLAPTSGEIRVDGALASWRGPMDAIARGLGMVQQHFSLVEPLSAIDNIALGAEECGLGGRLDRARAIARVEAALPSRSLAVPWLAPVGELSVGEKQRVEILKLLFRDAQVLFLDEPTAVLAPAEVQDFFGVLAALKATGRTVVLITHKINEVFQICDRYSVLRAGRIVAGGEVRDATEESIVSAMIGRRRQAPPARREPSAPATGSGTVPSGGSAAALRCEGVSELGDGRGRAKGMGLVVRYGEIVGIAGVEGSGQSSLVETIMGLRPFSGTIEIAGQPLRSKEVGRARLLGCGLIPEDRLAQAIWPEESVSHNLIIGLERRFSRYGLLRQGAIEGNAEAQAREFDVRAPSLASPIGSLSGGNQQKAVFAREIAGCKPKLLLCHQPTRGVDLGATEMLHQKLIDLRDAGVGILLIGSDLDELMALSDRILVLFEGQVAAEFARADFNDQRIGAAMTGASLRRKGKLANPPLSQPPADWRSEKEDQ